MDEGNLTFDDLPVGTRYDLVLISSGTRNLSIVKQLFDMGMRPDTVYLADFINRIVADDQEFADALRMAHRRLSGIPELPFYLKLLLFTMIQPGATPVAMTEPLRRYISDPRAHPLLLDMLREINRYVNLLSAQAQPLRSYLAQAGVDVPELLRGVVGNVAFERRKGVLSIAPFEEPRPRAGAGVEAPIGASGNSTTGGRRRRRTIRRTRRTRC